MKLFAERHPIGRRRCFEILIEKRNVMQGDDIELQRVGREAAQCLGDLERKTLFAKAADKHGDVVRSGHLISSDGGRAPERLTLSLASPEKDASASNYLCREEILLGGGCTRGHVCQDAARDFRDSLVGQPYRPVIDRIVQ